MMLTAAKTAIYKRFRRLYASQLFDLFEGGFSVAPLWPEGTEAAISGK